MQALQAGLEVAQRVITSMKTIDEIGINVFKGYLVLEKKIDALYEIGIIEDAQILENLLPPNFETLKEDFLVGDHHLRVFADVLKHYVNQA